MDKIFHASKEKIENVLVQVENIESYLEFKKSNCKNKKFFMLVFYHT